MVNIDKPKISYTPVNIKVVDFRSRTEACPDCGRVSTRHKELKRNVIDIDLERPTVLVILYNTYLCRNPSCSTRHFQIDNLLVQKKSRYSRRAKEKMVKSVAEDGVTIRTARNRAKRDFNISPANATISRWTHKENSSLLMGKEMADRVLEEFSGILCVDETYDKDMAMLVAVDPVQKKTIAYSVTHGRVSDEAVKRFLEGIKASGLKVHTCVTDKSTLYPHTLQKVFGPGLRHQLCLYHLSANVVLDVYNAIRGAIYLKEKTRTERQKALRQIYTLIKNPRNLLKRAGKSLHSQKQWAEKGKTLQKAVRKTLKRYPYLKIYYDFLQAYYRIWEAKTERETWKRRDALLRNPRFTRLERFRYIKKRLEDDKVFQQYLHTFKDARIPRTNNGVERVNRKFRQQQKKRYRGLRYEKARQQDTAVGSICKIQSAA